MLCRPGSTRRRSLRQFALALAATILAVSAAHAGTLNLSWTAPTTNVDGTPLTDLAAYRVYYGTAAAPCPGTAFVQIASPTSTPSLGQTLTATLTNLPAGTLYYVSMTAIDANGMESACVTPVQSAVARVAITVSPAEVNFGSVVVGSVADQTFTVQNTGAGTISGTVTASAPFSVVSGSSFGLAGGATQSVVVRFNPTVAASVTGNVTFTAGGDSVSRVLSGTGTTDSTPPSVLITSPTSGATYATTSATLTLAGTASDNVGVTQVTWINDRGGSGTATGIISWTAGGIVLKPGANVITVTARDAAGNKTVATLTATMTDVTAPTVTLTAPTAGASVTGAVNITATATDNIGVAGVQFRLDGANLGAEKTTAPYSVSWDTTTTTGGSHTLTAIARDAAGNSTTSAPIAVTVVAPPTVGAPLSVLRAASPITVDGSLVEWTGATPVRFSGRSNSATAYLLWDATNLYVAFQVTDSQLNATRTARDAGSLYQDDSVEVYIDTRNDRATTMQSDDYQFLVNLNNVQGDLRGTGTGKNAAWNATWLSAVRRQGTLNVNTDTDTGYTVEIAIPWAQIGVTPVSGMSFGIDLVVNDRDGSTFDYFDWAGIAPNSFAQPSRWKQITLVGVPTDTVVAAASGPITVDGDLSDWVGATAVQFSGSSNGATAYLLWDPTNLYVAFRVTDSQLNATRTARDAGDLYQDDAVEIYIDTRNDRASTMQTDDYQFLVNLNNVQGDLRGTGTGKDPAWNGSWSSAVRLWGSLNANTDTDGGYIVEIAIPWAQIGVTPTSGMSFGIDLAVDDRDAASFDYFDWAGIAPNSFAQPSLWKRVRLQ
jgi:hypothetical protein